MKITMLDGTVKEVLDGGTIQFHPKGWKTDPARRKAILAARRARQRNSPSQWNIPYPPSVWPYGRETLDELRRQLRAAGEGRLFISYRPRPWRVKVRFNTPGVGWGAAGTASAAL